MTYEIGTTINIEKLIRNTSVYQRRKLIRIGKAYNLLLPPITNHVVHVAKIIRDENDLKRLPIEYARKLIAIFNIIIHVRHYKNNHFLIDDFLENKRIYPKSFITNLYESYPHISGNEEWRQKNDKIV
ncbi:MULTISPECIES: hypothetical protein [Lactococcus]|uniref:hypothetical protein n=1 Tax=Lactococcus TaxID=1357 RepID=UPI0018D9854A|nr:hypothetical protein [Lactococcus garvieae]QPS70799.1 hypothetical protein I6G50_08710 [Lactococcus garvieae]